MSNDKTIPSIEEWKNMMTGKYDNVNLDFAYIDLKNSFWEWFDNRELEVTTMNFYIKFHHIKSLMQSSIYRILFSDCKDKILNMYLMMSTFKILNKFKL